MASSKCLLGILKKLTTKNACAVRARAEAHKTYSSIAQVLMVMANGLVHTCARHLLLPR